MPEYDEEKYPRDDHGRFASGGGLAGRERNQLAIWDVKGKAEIDTGGTGR